MAIAVDASVNAYVTGLTASANFPTTAGAYDTTFNGAPSDAFVTKLDMIGGPATMTLTPTTATNTVGNPHTVTATVRDFAGRPVPGVTVRFTVTVSNPTTGSCVTLANGQCSFTYTGTVAGPDTIAAYADSNNSGTQDPGEPTAAASKLWTPGAPATLVLTPATATNTVGTMHTVTATVKDVFGNPVSGVRVYFTVTGPTFPSPASGSGTSNGSGVTTFMFTASLPGTNAITAYADTNGNSMQDIGEPSGLRQNPFYGTIGIRSEASPYSWLAQGSGNISFAPNDHWQ
jgi:uncharacterized protein (DUF2141 family)